MNHNKRQAGFAAFEVILFVVVLVIMGFVAYKALYPDQTANEAESSPTKHTRTASDVPNAPTISSAADLTAAEATLDKVDPNPASDSTQLDAELATF